MKYLLYVFPFLFLFCTSSQPTVSKVGVESEIADFYIAFGSVCCGPTSTQPLAEYIVNFLNSNNLQFSKIEDVTSIGKEGEHIILLYCEQWSENEIQQFYDGLQKIHWQDQESTSFGGVEVGTQFKGKKLEMYPHYRANILRVQDLFSAN